VELAYGPDFELEDGDAEVVVQLRGRDVLWQKERLLNVALEHLPPDCRYVAWVDADIIFGREDWADATIAQLRRVPLVQPFGRVQRLPAGVMPEDGAAPEQTLPSTASALAAGQSSDQCLTVDPQKSRFWSSLGTAWAARRDLLKAHRLFDACIVGGGDRAIVCGALGCFDNIFQGQLMNQRQRDYYRAWAEPFHSAVQGSVGHVDGDVFHLWHGSWENRRLRQRHADLARHNFDPYADLALDENGCWKWNSDKPELHQYVRAYFLGRQENGE
jgi:hypothetical protein